MGTASEWQRQVRLKGGELRLHLENAELTLASEELSSSWVLATEKETPHEENKQSKSIDRKSYGEKVIQETNQLQLNYCQILQSDSKTNLSFIFQIKTGDSVFQGSLKSKKLGTVNITGKPCRVEAIFEIYLTDLSVTDAEGLWQHDIHPNQYAVLERKLALFLWESKLKLGLSWVQLCYDCPPVEKEEIEFSSTAPIDLSNLIQQIITSQTHDLLELAKIAKFNP